MAESLNGTYKAELVRLHGPWRTRQALEAATVNWIHWYDEIRLHSELGDMPHADYEYLHNQPVPAGSTT
jgi:putative transposase